MKNNINKERILIENEIVNVINYYKDISFFNQEKVLDSFRKNNVSDFHFNPSTGYGYGDVGREVLEDVFADIFGGESALVRPHIASGTHAISLCFFSFLKKGDELISIGEPYETLKSVIGLNGEAKNSLLKRGVKYHEIPFNLIYELEQIENYFSKNTKMVFIQRSRGYQNRETLTLKKIHELITFIKRINNKIIILVDNCYGEFVEKNEPCDIGADLTAGSLIKNPGGGLAPTGGYVVGKNYFIDLVAEELFAPGLGKNIGSSLSDKRLFYQGLFIAPHVVMQALESMIFASKLFEKLGFEVDPVYDELRSDIIQTITFRERRIFFEFCEAIQAYSPVDSMVRPKPELLPGYNNAVIMAAGTFVQGSSIELSVDGLDKEPYQAYLQGGLTSESSKYTLLKSANLILEEE